MAHNDSFEDRSPEIVIRKPLCWADEGSTTPDVCIERVGPDELNIVTVIGGQPANTVYAGPTSGSPSNPSFRALVPLDVRGFTPTTTGLTAPGTVSKTGCSSQTPVLNPFAYVPLADATFAEWGCMDESVVSPPDSPAGTPEFVYRTWWNNTGVAMPGNKNRLLGIYFCPGKGGVTPSAVQDSSGLAVTWDNATASVNDFRQEIAGYSDFIISGAATNFHGHAGFETDAGNWRGSFNDGRSSFAGNAPISFSVYSAQMTRSNAGAVMQGSEGKWICFAAAMSNSAGGVLTGTMNFVNFLSAAANSGGATGSGSTFYGFRSLKPNPLFVNNYGFYAENFGTAAADFGLVVSGVNSAGTPSGFSALVGPVKFGVQTHAATGYQIDSTGAVKIQAAAGVSLLDLYGSTSGHAGISVAAAAGTPNTILLPTATGSSGQVLSTNGANPQQTSWITPVTSVALSLPGIFSVSGSPVTSSGTLTGTLATQTANTVFAGPTSGGATAPTFRALVAADIPLSSKIQTIRSTSNCTTGSSGHDSCTDVLTWGTSFGDTNYTVTCSCADANIGSSGETAVFNILSYTATQVTVVTQTEHDTRTAHCQTIGCVGVHD